MFKNDQIKMVVWVWNSDSYWPFLGLEHCPQLSTSQAAASTNSRPDPSQFECKQELFDLSFLMYPDGIWNRLMVSLALALLLWELTETHDTLTSPSSATVFPLAMESHSPHPSRHPVPSAVAITSASSWGGAGWSVRTSSCGSSWAWQGGRVTSCSRQDQGLPASYRYG